MIRSPFALGPNPMTDKNIPVSLFFDISSLKSSAEVIPILKSPSVNNTTLLFPPSIKYFCATSYAVLIPPLPFVTPPALSSLIASSILSKSFPFIPAIGISQSPA